MRVFKYQDFDSFFYLFQLHTQEGGILYPVTGSVISVNVEDGSFVNSNVAQFSEYYVIELPVGNSLYEMYMKTDTV